MVFSRLDTISVNNIESATLDRIAVKSVSLINSARDSLLGDVSFINEKITLKTAERNTSHDNLKKIIDSITTTSSRRTKRRMDYAAMNSGHNDYTNNNPENDLQLRKEEAQEQFDTIDSELNALMSEQEDIQSKLTKFDDDIWH